ncbi:MAG: SRPBCC family protein [Solimonas sp.]
MKPETASSTDRIEKKILLKAPLERVWRAISDAQQFGYWFGVDFDGAFVEGRTLSGRIACTRVDAEVAEMQRPYEGTPFAFRVESIEPMRRIAFRWHPYAIEKGVDYSQEPMTLIEFILADADGGILLTISESGFDRIPLARRAQAFAANDGGWEAQTKLVAKFLALPENP